MGNKFSRSNVPEQIIESQVDLLRRIEEAAGNDDEQLAIMHSYISRNRHNLDFDFDVTLFGGNGSTLLILAAESGDFQMVESLASPFGLRVNVDINAVNVDGNTALIVASERGFLAIVDRLLSARHINASIVNRHGESALMMACAQGHIEIARRLLNDLSIESINASNAYGNTALIMASAQGHTAIVELLMAVQGIDIYHQNNNNRTAAQEAQRFGHQHIAALFGMPSVENNSHQSFDQQVFSSKDDLQERLDAIECKEIPVEFICPVSKILFGEKPDNQPVTLSTGMNVARWVRDKLASEGETFLCPVTRKELISAEEIKHETNWDLKSLVGKFVKQEEEKYQLLVRAAFTASAEAVRTSSLLVMESKEDYPAEAPDNDFFQRLEKDFFLFQQKQQQEFELFQQAQREKFSSDIQQQQASKSSGHIFAAGRGFVQDSVSMSHRSNGLRLFDHSLVALQSEELEMKDEKNITRFARKK